MAVSATIGGDAAGGVASGVSSLPTPVKLAAVGGAIGLVVLLTRKKGTPADTGGSTTIPNTNILLGSLQESVLNLQGQVGSSEVNLSSQLAGTQENLSSGLDQWGGQLTTGQQTLQQGLASISKGITGLSTQQTNDTNSLASILTAIGGNLNNYYSGISQQTSALSAQVLGGTSQVIAGQSQIASQLAQLLQNTPTQVAAAGGFTSNNDHQISGGDSANWLMQRADGSKYWIHFRNGGVSLEGT